MSAETIQPAAQKLSSNTTTLPLSFASTLSDTNVEATGVLLQVPFRQKNVKSKILLV